MACAPSLAGRPQLGGAGGRLRLRLGVISHLTVQLPPEGLAAGEAKFSCCQQGLKGHAELSALRDLLPAIPWVPVASACGVLEVACQVCAVTHGCDCNRACCVQRGVEF